MSFHRRATYGLALLMLVLGVLLLVETARAGGGTFGYAAGVLFAAAGCGRLYLLRR